MFLPHPRVKVSIAGSLRDREVACSASDRQGSNFESCVWRTVSSQSFHHPQKVLLAQFSLYVHKGGLKPDSFHLFRHRNTQLQMVDNYSYCMFIMGPKNHSHGLLCNPFSAGTDFRSQNLTSIDVRFRRLKSIPAPKELQIYNGRRPMTGI